jgi:two-component system sensor histidine kinase PilS (NtrC family)
LVLEDLSRVHQQAQQIKLAALGRLTANIAHEIRNPLSSISHAAQILQEDANEDKTHIRLLQIIHDNTKRIDRLVGDVLALNRRDRVQPESIMLTSYLPAFIEEFRLAENIPLSGIYLSIDKGGSVCFDRSHLNQILWNLCRNGWRYSRKQANSIALRVDVQHSRVDIHIIDDGAGIPAENMNKLFEPFFTTDSLGTGLGLYISREMCEANHASLNYIADKAGGHFKISCREGT